MVEDVSDANPLMMPEVTPAAPVAAADRRIVWLDDPVGCPSINGLLPAPYDAPVSIHNERGDFALVNATPRAVFYQSDVREVPDANA